MGSLTPPWADELLARNTKIARKMMSSISTESYFEDADLHNPHVEISASPPNRHQRPNRFLASLSNVNSNSDDGRQSPSVPIVASSVGGVGSANSKVVEPPPATDRMASSQSSTCSSPSFSPSAATVAQNNNNPAPSGSLRILHRQSTRNTEKLSPIRNERESIFVDDDENVKKGLEMTNGGEDLSILEYGPGIVKKLRSRYQSLALRQYSTRPTLRRSASLENCLDAVSAEELVETLESKISDGNSQIHESGTYGEEENTRSGRERRRNRFQPSYSSDSRTSSPGGSMMTSSVIAPSHEPVLEQNGNGIVTKSNGPRGRTSGPDATARRDRMRRARSVDALHRSKREEEILEKFKHVVLPKEEIVIIEVSKPPQTGGAATAFHSGENGHAVSGPESRFQTTRLLLTSNNLRNSGAVTAANILDQQTANKVRNLMISPPHELPPADIVRETARIFERNQENLNRQIGQALRLSKSASASAVGVGSSSPLMPSSPTPTTTTTSSQQAKNVTAQSTSAMQSQQDKSFPTTKTKLVEANNTTAQTSNNTTMANGPSHGQKQIGIIKPTLSHISGNNGVVNVNGKVAIGNGSGSESNRVRSPILSPIQFNHTNKPFLQNSSKPPLSPKPIFTSSPKVNISEKSNTTNGLVSKTKTVPRVESPSTSPILLIENAKDRSISPFKSESPILSGHRAQSPIIKSNGLPNGQEDRNELGLKRTSSPIVNGKVSPVTNGGPVAPKRVGFRSNSPEEAAEVVRSSKTVSSDEREHASVNHRQQVPAKEQSLPPPPPPRTVSPNATVPPPVVEVNNTNNKNSSKPVSQLRVHQKKSNQGGNGSMVFNFTTRKDVPDYIEDDGLRQSGRPSAEEELSSLDKDSVDSKHVLPMFEGANVIINGRSSIQKKPKSQKMSISFNEDATTTHEYPSESSFVVEEEPSENENYSAKKPNVISGSAGSWSSLSSYTPKAGANTYQLGSYNTAFDGSSSGHNTKKLSNGGGKQDAENDFIEDYLKPTTESTTWSNEMSADILF